MLSPQPSACPFCRVAIAAPATACPRDGHPAEAVSWRSVPATLSKRFRVLEPFAHGATGSLYLADEFESGQRGLLKILEGVSKSREPERARLRRELGKQSTLSTSRLSVPWAIGESDGITWVFRPWLDGVSLQVRLRQAGPPGVDEALSIGAQLAIALDELHGGGLLHRDLKPGHVFLQTTGQGPARAFLIDAGVCAPVARKGNSTVFGTPGYVAPEQLQGRLVSFRSDLYSFGCVLYEALAGRPAFEGATPEALFAAQLAGAFPPLPGDLPEGIVPLLRSLLSKEPQERPFSAQKLRRILEPYAPGNFMTRPPTSTFGTLPDPEKPAAPRPPEPSLPPPPPAEALRASKSSLPPKPVGRPTARGFAPPPRPPHAAAAEAALKPAATRSDVAEEASAEETQQLDIEQLELVSQTGGDGESSGGASADSERERDDLTVPVRLDQILAISPARARAVSSPPPLEPPRTEPKNPGDDDRTIIVEGDDAVSVDLSTGAEPTGGLPALGVTHNALFGAVPTRSGETSFEAHDRPGESDDSVEDESTRVASNPLAAQPSEHPASFAQLMAGDEDAATALPKASGLAPNSIDDNDEEAALAGRRLQETLRPYWSGLSASQRKLALGGVAAAALLLLVFGAGALLSDDEGELAANNVTQAPAKPAASAPQVSPPTKAVDEDPTPSVTALAAAPKGEAEAEPEPELEAPADEPSAAEASAERTESADVTLTPMPVVEPIAANDVAPQPAPQAKASEPTAAPEKHETASKPRRLSAAEKRRQKREEQARLRAEKRARARSHAKSESSDRNTKWQEAVEEARKQYAAKRYKQAAQAYERATHFDPTSDRTFSGLGTARFRAGDYKGAAAAYQRAVQLSPNNSVYHTSLARAYQQMGNVSKAKAEYKRAVALDPKNEGAKKSLKQLGG